jgi:hypothetical protein
VGVGVVALGYFGPIHYFLSTQPFDLLTQLKAVEPEPGEQ